MARILIATVPVFGHVNPMLPLARAFVARGHEVVWYTGAKYAGRVSATGARHVGLTHARDDDDARFDEQHIGRAELRGLAQLKFDMKHIFIDNGPGQAKDLEEIAAHFALDVLVADPAMIGAAFFAERTGVPAAILGVLPLPLGSAHTAPFGLGLPPKPGAMGRWRNKALRFLVERYLFRDVQAHWNATRARIGLPPTGFWIDHAAPEALFMQPTIPEFEYPRPDLRQPLAFIGPLPAEVPSGWRPPSFWHELDGPRPVVHVTQGTLANATPQLIGPALAGLAREDVLVVVSTGGRPIASLGLELPANARVSEFLFYPDLLPKTAVMLTNGGYGGTQMALAAGVPVIVAGTTEDKPEVGARVAWSGAGLNLKTASPSPATVRRAVREVLDNRTYRTRAKEMAAIYRRYDAVARATELVEGLLPETRRTPRPEGKVRVVPERRDRQRPGRAEEALRSA